MCGQYLWDDNVIPDAIRSYKIKEKVVKRENHSSNRDDGEDEMKSDWQPMETAPSDREILIYSDTEKRIAIYYWCDDNEYAYGYFIPYAMATAGMPLPEAPE